MARLLALDFFLFLLPFILYAGYLLATKGSFRNVELWQRRTVAWLALGGSLLLLVVILVFIQYRTVPGDAEYRPAQYIDGKIVPGELIPPTPEGAAGGDN